MEPTSEPEEVLVSRRELARLRESVAFWKEQCARDQERERALGAKIAAAEERRRQLKELCERYEARKAELSRRCEQLSRLVSEREAAARAGRSGTTVGWTAPRRMRRKRPSSG